MMTAPVPGAYLLTPADFLLWTSSTIGGSGDVTYLSPFWEGTAQK